MGHGHSSELHPLNILAFCDWQHRGICTQLSRALRSSLQLTEENQGYWRFLCERLAEEHDIYVPRFVENGCPIAKDWRALFLELNAVKEAADGKSVEKSEDFKIGVAARFRPSMATSDMAEEDGVVLPLHQKVQLVRRQLGCTSKEAVSLIMQKQQRLKGKVAIESSEGIFQPCLSPGYDKEHRQQNTDMIMTNEKKVEEIDEVNIDARCSILSVQEEKASVLAVTKNSGLHDFAFDKVFAERTLQPHVYEEAARRLVMEFLNGTSASIICYGQTASGKTHTMFGPPGQASEELQGLVPRTCAEVLQAVERWSSRGLQVQLSASYVELFGSEVSDLLREGRVVGQHREGRYSAVRATDRVGHRYVLDGHTEWHIQSLEELQELLEHGDAAKRRAATAMNERSTRAHTVFVLSLQVTSGDKHARQSRFYFADLGGSEQLSKSKVDAETKAKVLVVGGEEQSRLSWQEYNRHRQRVYETLNINKGLFSLKRVIEALHQRCRMAQEGVPSHALPYVPYQDSKLTMLLQEALGGSARTLIITTVTMDPTHAEESLQTLRFAETCAQVQKRREGDQAASIIVALDKIEQEIQALQQVIARKERWETRLLRRQDRDTVAGAFGEGTMVERIEVVPTSVLVGAEVEREQLEALLHRQAELKGLSSGISAFGKDYRSMRDEATKGAVDGGRGEDFRAGHFSSRTKAKDFEDEAVLADALRFFFRSCQQAEAVFGELKARTRLQRNEIPEGYHKAAKTMRQLWEDQLAQGHETRSFGKAMLDRCTAWRAAFKVDTSSRDAALSKLIHECGLQVE